MESLAAWPKLAALVASARNKGTIRTGVVFPMSEQSLSAACEAHRLGIIEAVLYGPESLIKAIAEQHGISLAGVAIVNTSDNPKECATQAINDCKAGTLGALMKGSLHTDEFLGAAASRRSGLLTKRRMSHVFVFDVPSYPKLLLLADAVVNVAPSLKSKVSIVQNAIDAAHKIGLPHPMVAILAAVEMVQANIPATLDAAALVDMAAQGRIAGATLDGPFGFDNAVSETAARIKGISSPVAGHADILIAPDLNSGNILYKSLIYMAGAECAGVILGISVPMILTSRADSQNSRIASCALANLMVN
jgi:phosphate acetyltransferase